jgi:hypothetical protein
VENYLQNLAWIPEKKMTLRLRSADAPRTHIQNFPSRNEGLVRKLSNKISRKPTQLYHVIRRDNSIQDYLTSLSNICKNFRTRNPFVNVVCTDPSNSIFLFCKNGGRDRVFVLYTIMLHIYDENPISSTISSKSKFSI